MSERPTPETDGQASSIGIGCGGTYSMVDAEFARNLERKRDELREALMKIEEIFIDGEDTYLDFVRVGNTAREALEK